MPFSNMYPYNQAPTVNYPTGDYRGISRLDRNRAEMTRNTRLGGELDREQQWKNTEFQKRLEELQRNLFGGGGIGGSVSAPAYGGGGGGIGAMGRGGSGGPSPGVDRMRELNPLSYAMIQNQIATNRSYQPRPGLPAPGPADTPYTAQFGTLTDPAKQKMWMEWMGMLMGGGR